jgi:hypothetical protein
MPARRAGLAILGALAVVAWAAAVVSGQALRPGALAPDVAGASWINSEPLTMAGLRGRVVLVEFWTHG